MVNQGLSRWTTKSKSVVIRHTSSIGAGSNEGKSRRLIEFGLISSAAGASAGQVSRPDSCHPFSISGRRQDLGDRPGESLERQVEEPRARWEDDNLLLALDGPGNRSGDALGLQIHQQAELPTCFEHAMHVPIRLQLSAEVRLHGSGP